MIQITCKGNSASCTRTERLTSGMVGLQCEFIFDEAWDGLAKTAVFLAGNEQRDVLLTGALCTVPWEVLQHPGYQLVIGVYGSNADGTLIIPTVYAMCGSIAPGADPSGDESTDPTLPVWGQIQGQIGNLANLETTSKDNLVAAVNDVKQTADAKANAADLAPVATSGNYSDLFDKPTIPSVPTATIDANTAARHTHDNKTLLDSITEAVKTAWNTASEWVSTNGANVLSHLSDGVRHIAATERSAWNGKQDKLIAGENITIADDGKTISATGGGGGGSAVALDTTLSEAGKAADAKAVGDALAEKQPKGDYLTQNELPDMTAYRTAEAQDVIDAGKQDTLIQSGASVGQIAKITAVDDSGKPTAWEAVDMPTGGSSEEMRVIKTITITAADVNSIYFNRDDSGLPFALTKHIRIRMYGAATNTGSTSAPLFFRAGQTIGDGLQSAYPIKVNSHNGNYVFDFVWDLYSTINCWYGDFAYARASSIQVYRYVPSDGNNVSDITVREIKLVWSNASVFFQQGATIVVEGI